MRRSGEGGCAHSWLGPDSQRVEKGASLRLDHNLSHSILLEALVNQSFKEKRGREQRSFSALDPKVKRVSLWGTTICLCFIRALLSAAAFVVLVVILVWV